MDAALPDLDLPIARVEIPLTAAFQNAAAERRALLAGHPDSLAADAYRRLAHELRAPQPTLVA